MSEDTEVQAEDTVETKRPNWRQVKAERAAAAAEKRPSAPKRVDIMLEENDGIPSTGQFFGLNGASFILRPGMVASVPIGIVNILNDAVEDAPVLDPATKKVVGWRKKLRYPYRIINDQRAA